MPEEIELPEVDHAAEQAHEKAHERGGWLRWLALYTAILAVLAAIASLLSGQHANESLKLMNQASVNQAQASDQWAFYQAKGIKAMLREAHADQMELQHVPAARVQQLRQEVERYQKEQEDIKAKADELEKQRDEKMHESDEALEQHHKFAYTVTLLQVAIGLAAIAAILEQRKVFGLSLGLGAAGALFFAYALH